MTIKKLELKDLLAKIAPVVNALRRYLVIIACVVVAFLYGFLIIRINLLLNAAPSEAALAEKLSGVKRPKVDQATIDKLEALEDQNVQVQSLFNEARKNPFSE